MTFHLIFTYLPIYLFLLCLLEKVLEDFFFFFLRKHQTNRHYHKTPLTSIYPPKVPFILPECYLFSHKYLAQVPVIQKMPFFTTSYHLLSSISMPSNSINAEEADVERSLKTCKTFWN